MVFNVLPYNIRGHLIDVQTKSERQHPDQILYSDTTTQDVFEPKPDFGVTVTNNGSVLTARHVIAVNVAGKRVGSFANPILVEIPQATVIFARA